MVCCWRFDSRQDRYIIGIAEAGIHHADIAVVFFFKTEEGRDLFETYRARFRVSLHYLHGNRKSCLGFVIIRLYVCPTDLDSRIN